MMCASVHRYGIAMQANYVGLDSSVCFEDYVPGFALNDPCDAFQHSGAADPEF